jgi:hypothetical protein
MGNYRKAQFLNREFTHLDKPVQEYIESLAKTLLFIQSAGEIELRKQGKKIQISLKNEGYKG